MQTSLAVVERLASAWKSFPSGIDREKVEITIRHKTHIRGAASAKEFSLGDRSNNTRFSFCSRSRGARWRFARRDVHSMALVFIIFCDLLVSDELDLCLLVLLFRIFDPSEQLRQRYSEINQKRTTGQSRR